MTLTERLQEFEAPPAVKHPARPGQKAHPGKAGAGWGQMKRRVRDALLEEIGPKLSGTKPQELSAVVSAHLDQALKKAEVSVNPAERLRFVGEVAADLLGYGPLNPLLEDPSVTEIMCNSYDDIWVERSGRIEHTSASFIDEGHFRQVIEKIVVSVGRRIDENSPMVDARLPDGSRVNVVVPPVSVYSPVLTIRRFPEDPFQVKDLINFGTISMDLALFLEACVAAKLNIVVSGGTGTGKTTLLNVVSSFLPDNERIITIEDAAELRLHKPHVVSLESRPANIEGSGYIAIRDLVRNALRMRPDRIIVGEVRGPEALDMLQAMNTGHEGSLTTVHCNSPRDALSRLETMVLMAGYDLPLRAIRQQIASAIDLIVHLDRLGDGSRRVTVVTEIQAMEGEIITLQDIFRFDFVEGGTHSAYSAGGLRPTGLRPKLVDKLAAAGVSIAPKIFRPAMAAADSGALNGARMRRR